MPTGAKLMAALSFAIVGWIVANAYVPTMPSGTTVGLFRELCGVIGALVGWKVMGGSVGKGYGASIGSGWKTVIVLVFFALLIFSTREMVLLSMKMRYDGPVDAVLAIFELMMEKAQALLTPNVLVSMVVGGAVAGLLSESASRRWP
jgi:hypothetical protein